MQKTVVSLRLAPQLIFRPQLWSLHLPESPSPVLGALTHGTTVVSHVIPAHYLLPSPPLTRLWGPQRESAPQNSTWISKGTSTPVPNTSAATSHRQALPQCFRAQQRSLHAHDSTHIRRLTIAIKPPVPAEQPTHGTTAFVPNSTV